MPFDSLQSAVNSACVNATTLLEMIIGVGEMPLSHEMFGIGVCGLGGAPPVPEEVIPEPETDVDEATLVVVTALVEGPFDPELAVVVVPPVPALVDVELVASLGSSDSGLTHDAAPKDRRPPSAALSIALLGSR